MLPAIDVLPAGHFAQTVVRDRSLLDETPATAYLPAAQVIVPVQVADVKPAVLPYVPAGQLTQAPPAPIEYVPARQGVH